MTKIAKDVSRIGWKNVAQNGQTITIVNYRGSTDVDLMFEDGTIVEHIEYSLTVIKNANAQVILGNEHLFGTRVFTDETEAHRVLEEKRAEEKKRIEQRCAEDMSED